jgi:hypothetical protein
VIKQQRFVRDPRGGVQQDILRSDRSRVGHAYTHTHPYAGTIVGDRNGGDSTHAGDSIVIKRFERKVGCPDGRFAGQIRMSRIGSVRVGPKGNSSGFGDTASGGFSWRWDGEERSVLDIG